MTTLAEVDVKINANLDSFFKSSKKAEKIINDLDQKLNKVSGKKVKINVDTKAASASIDRLLSSVSRLAIGVGAAFGVREIQQYADAWTSAGNKIRAASEIYGVQTRSLEDLNVLAAETRSEFSATVDLYAKLIRAASGVAKSEDEIARATETVNKAFKAGGATTQEQIAGITQLGQALGSGLLQGDELRSIRENAPLIANAIAKEFDTTIAGIKKLGEEGKLTSDRVFRAIINASQSVDAAFSKTNATIGDSFVQLGNRLTEYIGHMDSAAGITTTVNTILSALTNNITSVANAAAAAAVVLLAAFGSGSALAAAGALVNPWIALAAAIGVAAYALTEFWDDILPLQGSVATLGDYAIATWNMITEGANSASESIVSAFSGLNDILTSALDGVGVSFSTITDVIASFVNQSVQNFVNLKDTIVLAFEQLPSAIANGVVSAMNFMIGAVETGINKVIAAVNGAITAINSLASFAGVSGLGTIDSVTLARIEDSYAGAGEKAATAFGKIWSREAQNYVGAAGTAISDMVNGATTAIVDRANDVANARRELERETNRAANFTGIESSGKGSTAGFGTGFGTGGGTGGGSGGKKKKQSDYEKEIQQIKDRTAALVAETQAQAGINPLIDDYGYSSTRAKAAQELLTAAQKSGIAAGKELKDVNQLLKGEFNQLSPAAREQAQAMLELATKYGEAEAASDRLKESQDRAKQAMEDTKQLGKDVLGGFIKDLQAGKSASEALANALSKVADKLLDVGLDALFGINQGGGGGGLFGGLLTGLFGGLSFEGGGYTGSGSRAGGVDGKGGFAAILHPNETVVDHAKGINVPNNQLKPSVGGGTNRIEIDLNTNTDTGVITEIADTRIKTSAPTIIKASVQESQKQTKQNMPGYLANAQSRRM